MTENDSVLTLYKPQLADTLDFTTDIAPYPLVSIWAGVGAGKNYFVEKMITGSPKHGIPRMNVLIITSRKAKVVETLSREATNLTTIIDDNRALDDIFWNSCNDPDDFRKNIEVDDGLSTHIYQRSVICTNAFIEKYLQYRHHPLMPETHLWNRFDAIVWDEAHTLHTDSSYQSAPYHVMRLMSETYNRIRAADKNEALPEPERAPEIKRPTCKHLILMSGTPESIEPLFLVQLNPILDMRFKCHCAMPENIHFLYSAQATQQIIEQLRRNERIVYFSNHTALPKELSERFSIPSEKISVSFSKEEKRAALEKESLITKKKASDPDLETEYERMINVETYLAEHSRIRPDIQLFATTSRNKEGININDTDIRHVYVESHSLTDIKQMAGRIRNDLEHLYIILDSCSHGNTDGPYASYIPAQLTQGKINSYGKEESQLNINLWIFCKEHTIDLSTIQAYENQALGSYIDGVKRISPYIEFDYIDNEFHFNSYRYNSLAFYADELERFNEAASDPEKLMDFFLDAFPESVVYEPISPEEEASKLGWDFMRKHLNGCSKEELNELLGRLDELLTPVKNRRRRKSEKPAPNRLLRKIGLHCSSRNHKIGSPGYNEYIVAPIDFDELAS